MNLLLINYEYPPIGGGAGNATHFTAKALAELGHQVSVLTTAWKDQTGYQCLDEVHLYRIPAWRSDPSAAGNIEKLHFVWKARSVLPNILSERNIEAVIIYFTIPCGLVASKLKKIPYVISLRGGDVPGLVPEIDWIHNLIRPIRRKILAHSIATIANAEGLADLSRKADPYPVQIIPNGVDTDFFRPPENPKNEKNNLTNFLFVGRFHPQKNLHVLLDQISKIKQTSQKEFRLHLVGSGPLEEELKQYAKQLDLDAHITWHGWLKKNELRDLHQQCQVFINPSHYEGLPNAVLEAMASGLCIVVSDIPGNKDLIQDGAGYVYSHSNNDAFFDAIKEAHECPNPNYGPAARERALTEYTWKSVASQYIKLFN